MSAADRKIFFRMFRYVKPYAVTYTLGIFLYNVQGFLFPLINSLVFRGVTEGLLAMDFSMVINALVLMGILIVGGMLLVGTGVYMYAVVDAYILRDLRVQMFRAFMTSSLENEKHSGEGIATLNTDTNTATDITGSALSNFVRMVITAVFAAVTVFIVDWRMGLGALALGALVFFAQARFAAPLARLGKQQLESNADAVKEVSNIFSGALTIRAFGRQPRALISFDRENGKLQKIEFKQAFISMWQNLFTTVQGWLSLILVFVFGGYLVARGFMEFPQVMLLLPLVGAIGDAMSGMGAAFAGLQPPVVAARRVFDVIDAAPNANKPVNTLPINWNGDYTLQVEKLNFAYKNAENKALTDVTLTINPNEMVAFVGASGSGKSTMLRLLMGMYERDLPNVRIGNLTYDTAHIMQWRKYFSYVDQQCKLFDMSIAKNIAMGKQGNATQAEMEAAAERAFAHAFITEMPDGYESECGERGASLSGGQKQRIAIARALCHAAPILVFDEATSALDAESERNVMQTIENLRSDHTILITTHNLNNIINADKIVVMEQGKIAEIGTHSQLLAQKGVYYRLQLTHRSDGRGSE
ncbi:MAG: ABC transporter ATP-binding protein/permease [Defluviitaleaceae bacterium]|nr:ABC transporter ATP-binding protein/permease [Defluviitaleaceae bacterium]MCL2274012.1 ABC transporter ATP-binding protein/permease [Defluviitaleaceae bacterium]MCL2274087.1 ABC transporter ATP-binding protein/permease [Defluviitaleaceae bacterium]